jgi:hypothetical protein
MGNFDRSTFIRSIDFGQNSIDRVLQNFRIFQAIPHEFCHSSLIDLLNIKTQKLTKASENNKTKSLTNVNQGVQIHNIWHSSRHLCKIHSKIVLHWLILKWEVGHGEHLYNLKTYIMMITFISLKEVT